LSQGVDHVVETNNDTGAGNLPKRGTDSIALASDAHEDSTARFSAVVRVACCTTSRGCRKKRAGCRSRPSSGPNGSSLELEAIFFLSSGIALTSRPFSLSPLLKSDYGPRTNTQALSLSSQETRLILVSPARKSRSEDPERRKRLQAHQAATQTWSENALFSNY
jgi:hypothetical protein